MQIKRHLPRHSTVFTEGTLLYTVEDCLKCIFFSIVDSFIFRQFYGILNIVLIAIVLYVSLQIFIRYVSLHYIKIITNINRNATVHKSESYIIYLFSFMSLGEHCQRARRDRWMNRMRRGKRKARVILASPLHTLVPANH